MCDSPEPLCFILLAGELGPSCCFVLLSTEEEATLMGAHSFVECCAIGSCAPGGAERFGALVKVGTTSTFRRIHHCLVSIHPPKTWPKTSSSPDGLSLGTKCTCSVRRKETAVPFALSAMSDETSQKRCSGTWYRFYEDLVRPSRRGNFLVVPNSGVFIQVLT